MKKGFCAIFLLFFHLFVSGQTITASGPTSFCEGKNVVLSADGAPPGASFQWKKDGANIPSATNSSYSVTTQGRYSVEVNGSTTYGPVTVTVNGYPKAGFNFSPTNTCSNVPVTFTNTSTGTGLTYTWTFGDPNSGSNNTTTATHPSHTFIGTPGNGTQTFMVKLVADNNGCKDSITQTITTRQIPGVQLGGTGALTYNGLKYFTRCASTTSDFTFSNQSSTNATNTSYTIQWGDGTPDFTITSFTTLNHTYGIGNYNLKFIVTGANGCKDTGDYYVFVGNNPAVGFNNPGNTFICSNTSLTFPITGTTNNPPGTSYTVTFNDRSSPVTFTHPAPASVTHLFDRGSCGTQSGGFPNSFQADIQASNPCGTSAASVVPIYVSEKTKATIGYNPDTVLCVTNTLTVTNLSGSGYGISGSGANAVCTPGKGIWSITPATGWTITSGSLGNDFGSTDPSLWLNGSQALNIRFTAPGNYAIRLRTSASELCGGDEVTQIFCVNPAPVADFTPSVTTGCLPLKVSTVNKSNTPLCKANTYQWSVSYSNTSGCTPAASDFVYLNNTSATSAEPAFEFRSPGVYTISLVTRNSEGHCASTAVSHTITVKAKPQANITAPAAVCQNGAINPTSVVNNCYANMAATYSWRFPGGSPASSTAASPGSITYATAGTYTIELDVTNECGTTSVTRSLTVNPAPDVTVPADKVFCAGERSLTIPFTSSVPTATFAWTNSNTAIGLPASGSGSLPSFQAQNNTGSPLAAIITVTPTSGCSGTAKTFSITVNPRPAKPAVVRPVQYCLSETATPLLATALAGNSLHWYTAYPLAGESSTAPTPSTATAGTTNYYVTQSNGYTCQSDTAIIAVTILPRITNNTIGRDQTICSGSAADALRTEGVLSGGSGVYAYQWLQSTDGGVTWTTISGATSALYNPGAISANSQYRRLVRSGACSDTSNAVSITVLGSLTGNTVSAPQTVCAGTSPNALTGDVPVGGNGSFRYQWQQSGNNSTWADIPGATAAGYQPPALYTTTYYRRRVISGECQAASASVAVTVAPIPVLQTVTDKTYCNGATTGTIAFTSTPAAVTNWVNDNGAIGLGPNGTGNLAPFTATNGANPKIPLFATIKAAPSLTANGATCYGDTVSFRMIVLPSIAVSPIRDTALCTGQTVPAFTPLPDTGSYSGMAVSYRWTVSGSGINLVSGNGPQIPGYTATNNGSNDLTATITLTPQYSYNGVSCDGIPTLFRVTVKPATAGANAGADQVLCAQSTATLNAGFVNGTAGVWSQVGSGANITNPASNNTTVTGLLPGTVYKFVWTQSGFASCPASTDTVVIDNKPPLVNKIDTATRTVCAGTQINLAGFAATGGGNPPSYQWQLSTDGINFANIPAATAQNHSISPTATVWLRRFVSSQPCSGFSDTVKINVQPPLSNNNISADATICIGLVAPTITGTLPAGGNNQFTYQWQQSTNSGVTWTDIPSTNTVSYSPGAITETTLYRRVVSTDLCSGNFGSTSNTVTITVNPDAKAVFQPSSTVQCAPFAITPAVINLQPSPANSQYLWYADEALIGSGPAFPGYTIAGENDSVTIKLKVLSAFGCKSDSLSYQFKTPKTPSPSFTLSETVGCGPLTVNITNTSTYINEFTYAWDFGNGQTSTAVQPPAVTFAPNPQSGDTTYTITLHVFSPCDTLSFTRSVRVKSAPKALFTPVKTIGCSPMQAVFRNHSKGLNNTYHWDFGDGTTFSTTSADSVMHTYNVGRVDTFYVKLVAENECGRDSLQYAIVVSPNTVKLNFAVNGTEHFGCTPHTVAFINNTSGASTFQWNFGDGNILSTTKNIDTVYHTYQSPGRYAVQIRAFNSCSDTTATEYITVYPKPKAAFSVDKNAACIGDSLHFTNLSDSATSYRWHFGDGRTSTVVNPNHRYNNPGIYTVRLIIYRNNPSGNICIDSVDQQVEISDSLPGNFSATDLVGQCAPFTVTFVNGNRPSVTTTWDFGDGTTGRGDSIVHTYAAFGTYTVSLTTTVPGGCTYTSQKTVRVLGPGGSLRYTGGFNCMPNTVQLQAVASNTDSYVWDFGDGTVLATTAQTVYHQYKEPGLYLPSVTLKNNAGCAFPLKGVDTIRVDRILAGFTSVQQTSCGSTLVSFRDTSKVFFSKASVKWVFGDGTTGDGLSATHQYTASGTYPVEMIVYSNSGCSDTVRKALTVQVNSQPVATITASAEGCTGRDIVFTSNVQSTDAIGLRRWTLSNGASASGSQFSYRFLNPGRYTLQFIAGTVNGCYDTTTHTITINPSPDVRVSAGGNLCLGSVMPLTASGASSYQWRPLEGLSCYTCPSTLASPKVTTPYVVEGRNSFGCVDYDTAVITVIQPLRMTVSGNDSICIGQSAPLLVSGATNYSWSPAIGLSSTTVSNPIATPQTTTTYRVVGYDGFNCFTDTAFLTVAVGDYPTVDLGPDLSLAAGTQHPLQSVITAGPIRNWLWTPATDLSCATCPLPVANIKQDISYAVNVTTAYGCSATDTVSIKVFCEESAVFIPNAFTPDGDGINDILMVRSKGVQAVKYFRIFNRWGNLVFEKNNFSPNNPLYAWDGRINGVAGGPDVYVYTCEVICENGTSFTYKGNVSIIK